MNLSQEYTFDKHHIFFAGELTFSFLVAPFTIIGNLFVVLAVHRNHSMRTPTNYILVSLAVTDIGGGLSLFLMAYPAAYHTTTSYPHLAPLLSLPMYGLCANSVLHCVALTVDRYIAVTKPLQYPSIVSHRRIWCAVVFIWITGLIFAALNGLFLMTALGKDFCKKDHRYVLRHKTLGTVSFYGFIVLVASASILGLVISNIRIMQIAVTQSRAIANQRDNIRNFQEAPDEPEIKAVKTTAIIVGIFVLSWTPYIVFFILRLTTDINEVSALTLNFYVYTSVTISFAINPFIYHYRDKKFRNAFREIFQAASSACELKWRGIQ